MSFTCHWSIVGSLSKLPTAVAVKPVPLDAAASTVLSGAIVPIPALIVSTAPALMTPAATVVNMAR